MAFMVIKHCKLDCQFEHITACKERKSKGSFKSAFARESEKKDVLSPCFLKMLFHHMWPAFSIK